MGSWLRFSVQCAALTPVFDSPALSASLEYFKYVAGRQLPTQFMEVRGRSLASIPPSALG